VKAIVVQAHGSEECLRLEECPTPVPGPGDVLVRVRAAGVNYADLVQRRGRYRGGPRPPYVPGLEASGVIEAVGEGVSPERVGERVMMLALATYAEFLVISAEETLPVPDGWSFEEAAAFPLVTLTAYHGLHTVAHLRSGETVLIHAAAGGLGTAAVQIAAAAGACVIGTASSEEKLARVRSLGADHTVNYRTTDFLGEVQRITNDRGVDVVLESVGGDVFDRSLRALAPLGRLVVFGASSGEIRKIDPMQLVYDSQAVMGFHLRSVRARRELLQASLQEVNALVAAGKVRPIVGHIVPLAEAAEAHRQIAARATYGKVVLVP
jgi:NADPH2:quinone reductase